MLKNNKLAKYSKIKKIKKKKVRGKGKAGCYVATVTIKRLKCKCSDIFRRLDSPLTPFLPSFLPGSSRPPCSDLLLFVRLVLIVARFRGDAVQEATDDGDSPGVAAVVWSSIE